MDLLEKVEIALNHLNESKESETAVSLTFAELRGIRRDILVAEYGNKLSGENLRAGTEFLRSVRGESR